ncbi:MAG: hypothetical protein M4579_007046 [Chaenotheca gracillima]|nr:MAG: hypothetical protein M4579_007046 [Chaenotheca gracillima]
MDELVKRENEEMAQATRPSYVPGLNAWNQFFDNGAPGCGKEFPDRPENSSLQVVPPNGHYMVGHISGQMKELRRQLHLGVVQGTNSSNPQYKPEAEIEVEQLASRTSDTLLAPSPFPSYYPQDDLKIVGREIISLEEAARIHSKSHPLPPTHLVAITNLTAGAGRFLGANPPVRDPRFAILTVLRKWNADHPVAVPDDPDLNFAD